MTAANPAARRQEIMAQSAKAKVSGEMQGPPPLMSFSHVSVPCRDLEEGKRFYIDVLGGELWFGGGYGPLLRCRPSGATPQAGGI